MIKWQEEKLQVAVNIYKLTKSEDSGKSSMSK